MSRLHSFEGLFAGIPRARSDFGLCEGLRACLRWHERCPAKNEPRATYALGVHCEVLPQHVGRNDPSGVGVSGDGETPPGQGLSKQALDTEHLRIVSHPERPLRAFTQFASTNRDTSQSNVVLRERPARNQLSRSRADEDDATSIEALASVAA